MRIVIFSILSFLFFEALGMRWVMFVIAAPLGFVVQIFIGLFLLRRGTVVILTSFFFFSGILFALAPPPPPYNHVLFGVMSVLYALLVFALRERIEHPLKKEFVEYVHLFILFVFFSSLFYLFSSLTLPHVLFLLGIATATFWVTVMALPRSDARLSYTFVAVLAMSEIGWAISFLPFGALTLATLLFIVYYTLWKTIRAFASRTFTFRSFTADLVFLACGVGFILFITPWLP